MNTVSWNITVSSEVDQSLRMFLASHGGSGKGDLSRFVEKAVKAYILALTAEQAKAGNTGMSEEYLAAIIAEAVNGRVRADVKAH